jgi:hypothetical protein
VDDVSEDRSSNELPAASLLTPKRFADTKPLTCCESDGLLADACGASSSPVDGRRGGLSSPVGKRRGGALSAIVVAAVEALMSRDEGGDAEGSDPSPTSLSARAASSASPLSFADASDRCTCTPARASMAIQQSRASSDGAANTSVFGLVGCGNMLRRNTCMRSRRGDSVGSTSPPCRIQLCDTDPST